jgi:hypothetical protein
VSRGENNWNRLEGLTTVEAPPRPDPLDGEAVCANLLKPPSSRVSDVSCFTTSFNRNIEAIDQLSFFDSGFSDFPPELRL